MRKTVLSIVALIVLAGAAIVANNKITEKANDCCYPGSACCYPGSPCCTK